MPITAKPLWQRAISQLREVIPERTIENWLITTAPESVDTDQSPANFVLRVPSQFCKDYLSSNFRRQIEETLGNLQDQPVELTLRVDPSLPEEVDTPPSSSAADQEGEPSDEHGGGSSIRSTTSRAATDPAKSEPESSPEQQAREPSLNSSSQAQPSSDRPPSPESASDSQTTAKNGAPYSPDGLCSTRNDASAAVSSSRAKTASEARPDRSVAQRPSSAPDAEQDGASDRSSDHFQFSEEDRSLRPEFTFGHFLEGDSNRLARSASVAVAEEPGGTKYNPLVVYGDVGLGKTHLAQAIANYALEHETAKTICYVSSERFTSQFVTAIRDDNLRAFSNHYRNVDLLVVDDVQFFGGKEKTQEEFFHLFNSLHQSGKQIVLCADRPPSKISGIEDRLLSRFQWGLTADIQPPGLEMRMAVLQLKAEHLGLDLEPDVLELIAQNITENIRQLEGALKQLAARAQLVDGTNDSQAVRNILEREYGAGGETRQATVDDIIDGVAMYYTLTSDDLLSRSRRQNISNARQVAMYLSRQMTSLSYASIGRRFGGRDHSTVIHACNKVKDQLEVQPDFESELDAIRSEVRSHAFSD